MTKDSARHIVITGAAHGIGRATALLLRGQGAYVTALDRDDPGEAADAWLPLDVGDPAAVAALALDGPVHGLVNAAGLPPRAGAEVAILAVNVFGLRAVTEAVLPLMPPGGGIVHMASKAGARWRENAGQIARLIALPGPAALGDFVASEGIDPVRAYDLSKEAVIYWTKSNTARLMQLGLRANTVSPAAVDTRILGDFMSAFGARAERGVALVGRAGKPDDIAPVIAFLLGPDSGWLRGCDIAADGGLTAQLEIEAL